METNLPILSITIFTPLLSAIYIAFFVGNSNIGNKEVHSVYVAILSSIFTLIAAFMLLLGFDPTIVGFQFVEKYSWLDSIGLDFFVGVDGLSVYFIFLTSLLSVICIIASLFSVHDKIKEFLICFLLLDSFCIGAFASLNLLLFYGFFEMVLIPMYLIIGVWGGQNRIYAAVKFFLYTFFGSIFLLIALLYIYIKAGSFDIPVLFEQLPQLPLLKQQLLSVAILIAMAIKIPMLPFHTWLPDAHVQAPTAGSVMLAGILLKLGSYGMIRILLPMFPEALFGFAPYILMLSAAAIIYASLVALSQRDMKKMIAYSSVAHMGYVTGGLFSFTMKGVSGAIFQMISHGLISAALFLMVGMLYERHQTKEISKYGGVAVSMPLFSACFMVVMLGSIGLPGLSGFIGEFLTILGMFSASPTISVISALGIVLGALYMLRLYRDIVFGHPDSAIAKFSDLRASEMTALLPLVILVVLLGLAPNLIFSLTDLPVENLVKIYNFR